MESSERENGDSFFLSVSMKNYVFGGTKFKSDFGGKSREEHLEGRLYAKA